jgi:hypothetical protein
VLLRAVPAFMIQLTLLRPFRPRPSFRDLDQDTA